jgi:hypothetical protein
MSVLQTGIDRVGDLITEKTANPCMFTRLSKMSESTRFGSSENCSACCQKPRNSQECFSFSLPIPAPIW